ncbi:hypothetical protein UPYG_G00225540 [Umbra pygmaea]|uniref:Protein ELYS n=1 Tax=Umbra pygmaea TaxID=75934 RepID=A0ABD0WHP5_UMBPY
METDPKMKRGDLQTCPLLMNLSVMLTDYRKIQKRGDLLTCPLLKNLSVMLTDYRKIQYRYDGEVFRQGVSMRDLAAQVTSSLLRFPAVTIDALGEDEITLDSVLQGKFTVGRCGLAWLACGPQLEVVHAVTGERLSAYCFSGGGEHLPSVLAARDFSWLKRTGLLVGLEEAQGSMLCLYDLGISRVVKAVVIPGRITAIEPLVSYGGASASTQHLHPSLRWFFGVAAVVTDLGHVFLLDLCLDDLSCSQSELEASDLEVVTKSLAEVPRLREHESRQGRHLCLQLSSPTGTAATALQYIPRTNQLAVGFSDGYLQLWNMKTLKKEYHSQLEGGRVPVYAFTFQEPENDPRNCCYLWAVQSAQDHEGDVVSLHLLQLAFSERKCLASGKILYEGLEYCEERYSQELGCTAPLLRTQASNTRLFSCQTIEKFRPHPDRDDSMNEAASPDTSVSIFSWQVKAYGQGNPTTYIGVFDINRWYHAQMPDSLRAGESLRSCPYLAVWSLDSMVEMTTPSLLMDVLVHERSLSRGLPYTCPPPEQFFNPTTYNFDATCLLSTGLVHLTCAGYQKETLSFLKKSAPCSSEVISNGYSRCLMSGLLSARLADVHPSSLSQDEQLDAILSTAVETSSLGLITSCIKQWTAEEQPGSVVNLRYILEWAWDKVVYTKEELDVICTPLFDSSSNFTDPQTLQQLQHSQRLLTNLSTIFHCLLNEAKELTRTGLLGLINKNLVSSLISQYAQVVLWFCRTGLLPEVSDEDAVQISRPFYSYSVIQNDYALRREEMQHLSKGKWSADCLMIDGLVAQCGDRLVDMWKRDEGGTGQYPPSSLHALLDIYLLETIDESAKHAIVIYLLLDVMYSFPTKGGPSVESFPTAFAIPFSLVKLVQGLWLLDHHDHQNSLDLLLHPTTSHSPFSWQHSRVLQALMCQGQHVLALRYLHITKPPLSSSAQARLHLSVLLHNRCLVEAWTVLRQHSNRLNSEELLRFLYETCQELGLMKDLLKLPLGVAEQECLERFLQATGGLQNRELLMVHYLQQANYVPALQLNHTLKMNMVNERDPKVKERTCTRNSILDQYGKVLPRAQRKLAMERAKPYHHPSSVLREVARPQPLSTIAKRSTNENVLTRAAFINNVLSKIEEVWVGKSPTPQSTPLKSPRGAEMLCPSPQFPVRDMPMAFVGTPITMSSRRKSRLLDLVVHPSSHPTPPEGSQPLLTPPRVASSWNVPRSISKAPELSLLHTPQVVKRARALAASGPMFSAFTPQSILRSSLRPTPVVTPSASPRRSVTPPPRPKESRITFIEETASPEPYKPPPCWSNGMATENEISQMTRGFSLPKAGPKAWTSHPDHRGRNTQEDSEDDHKVTHVKFLKPPVCKLSPEPRECDNAPPVQEAVGKPVLPGRLSLGLETSQASVASVDTTLEFHDALLPENLEDDFQQPSSDVSDEDEVVVNLQREEREPIVNKPTPLTSAEKGQGGVQDEKDVSVKSQEDVQEPEQEIEMEVSPDQEEPETENVQSIITQEEPHHEEVNDPNPDPEVPHPALEAPKVILVEEMSPTSLQAEPIQHTEPCEPVDSIGATLPVKATEPSEVMAHTDLDQFVERHLFGNDLSPPLTRSGIHETSDTWTSFNSEPVPDIEESAPSVGPPAFTTQKSVASGASSDPAGTDSYSVVSLNDSEELSSAVDEEEEESDVPAEAEDSGSEVEIIEEVLGNRAPVASPPRFLDHLPLMQQIPLSEQDAAVLSLVTAGAELKMVEEDMEGEVLMVRLGAGEDDEEMCLTELKPSTTLLVPLELVEGQALTPGARLELTGVGESRGPEAPLSGAQSRFSLTLSSEDDDADTVPPTLPLKPSENLTTTMPEQTPAAHLFQDTTCEDAEPVDQDTLDGITLDGVEDSWARAENNGPVAASEGNVLVVSVSSPSSESVGEDKLMEFEPAGSGYTLLAAPSCSEDPDLEVPADSEPTECSEEPDLEVPADSEPTECSEEPDLEVQEGSKQSNGAREATEDAAAEQEVFVSCALKGEEMNNCVAELGPEEHPVSAHQPLFPAGSNGPIQPNNHHAAQEESGHKVAVILEETAQIAMPPTASKEVESEQPGGTSSSQAVEASGVKKGPSTPTRRATRQSKTQKFPSAEVAGSEEDGRPTSQTDEEMDSQVPATPRRITRSARNGQDSAVPFTPRRSNRKKHPHPEPELLPEQNEVEGESEEKVSALITEASVINATPSKQRTSQKATPRKGTRRTRGTLVGSEEEPVEEDTANDVSLLFVTRSTRKTRTGIKTPAVPTLTELPQEEETNHTDAKPRPISPGRVTRRTTRGGLTLALYTQEDEVVSVTPTRSRRKTRVEDTVEKTKDAPTATTVLPQEPTPLSGSRRLTRSRLWNHQEDDLLLLETPLEVDSTTPVADALIQRLRDEEAKRRAGTTADVTEVVRAKGRGSRQSGQVVPSPPPMEEMMVPEADHGSPVRDSFIYSPARRRTRVIRAEPVQNDVAAHPVTRTRRTANQGTAEHILKDKTSLGVDVEKETFASKPSTTKRRTTKPKAAPAGRPLATVDPISPLPSPADPAPRVKTRLVKENDGPAPRMNLRRKRVLEAIFPKPVTRRKRL